MFELKLRKIGKSIGVVLPKEVISRLKVGKDDTIYLTEGISRRYARALRDLAK